MASKIPYGYPVFRCKVERSTLDGQPISIWSFWCPWCRHDHTHGGGPGHRVAHCPDGPFKEFGYFIVSEKARIAPRRHLSDQGVKTQDGPLRPRHVSKRQTRIDRELEVGQVASS